MIKPILLIFLALILLTACQKKSEPNQNSSEAVPVIDSVATIVQDTAVSVVDESTLIAIKGFYVGMSTEECWDLMTIKHKDAFRIANLEAYGKPAFLESGMPIFYNKDGKLDYHSSYLFIDIDTNTQAVASISIDSRIIDVLFNSKNATAEQFAKGLIDNIPALDGYLNTAKDGSGWETTNTKQGVYFKVKKNHGIEMRKIASDSELNFN